MTTLFSMMKNQNVKMRKHNERFLECLEWYWKYLDARNQKDEYLTEGSRLISGKEDRFDELEKTIDDAWTKFTELAEEIRQKLNK
jgi:hypothetical protein